MRSKDSINTTSVAAELLELIPRLLQRLRPKPPVETVSDDPAWEDVSELKATTGQFRLLRVLTQQQSCKMQELAEQLGVTPSTATAMVKRLVTQGYLERNRDTNDWRSVWVELTDRGREALQVYDQARLASLEQRFAQLSEAERQAIAAALPAVRHLIELDLG